MINVHFVLVDKKANKKNIRLVPSAQSELSYFLLFEPMGVGKEDLYRLFMSLQKVGCNNVQTLIHVQQEQFASERKKLVRCCVF